MASSTVSSAAVSSVHRTSSPAQASMVAPFNGLKSSSAFLVTRKANDITSIASNGRRVQCMQLWPPIGLKKFETLLPSSLVCRVIGKGSRLPSPQQLGSQLGIRVGGN